MAQHIYIGTTPPTAAPNGVGHHYVDRVTKIAYMSVGTESLSDWVQTSTPGGGSLVPVYGKVTLELTPTDVANNSIDLPCVVRANSLILFTSGQMQAEGFAYTTETVDNKTRIHFIGDLQSPSGVSAIEAGDRVHIQYLA